MKITEHVYMLEVEGKQKYYPALIKKGENLILVDTGYPLEFECLKSAIETCGERVEDISHIILTHQDIDHIGCVKEVLEVAPKAILMAHELEAPYINGEKTPIKLAALDTSHSFYPQLKAGFENRRLKIDKLLKSDEYLSLGGGIKIVHTPGHTPGHICLYIEKDQVAICGDALNIIDGELSGANPMYTLDMALADQSIQKIKALNPKFYVTFHTGLYVQ